MKIDCLLPLLGPAVLALSGCSQATDDRADAADYSAGRVVDVTAGHLTVTGNGTAKDVGGILDAASRNAGNNGAGNSIDSPAGTTLKF